MILQEVWLFGIKHDIKSVLKEKYDRELMFLTNKCWNSISLQRAKYIYFLTLSDWYLLSLILLIKTVKEMSANAGRITSMVSPHNSKSHKKSSNSY